MPVTFDYDLPSHPKVIAAGPLPAYLFLCGLAYCAKQLTDGFIPEAQVPFLGVPNAKAHARKLVEVGLWERVKGGYLSHQYTAHNPPAEKVRAEREAARERMRRVRSVSSSDSSSGLSNNARNHISSPDVRPNKDRTSPDVRDDVRPKFGDPVSCSPVSSSRELTTTTKTTTSPSSVVVSPPAREDRDDNNNDDDGDTSLSHGHGHDVDDYTREIAAAGAVMPRDAESLALLQAAISDCRRRGLDDATIYQQTRLLKARRESSGQGAATAATLVHWLAQAREARPQLRDDDATDEGDSAGAEDDSPRNARVRALARAAGVAEPLNRRDLARCDRIIVRHLERGHSWADLEVEAYKLADERRQGGQGPTALTTLDNWLSKATPHAERDMAKHRGRQRRQVDLPDPTRNGRYATLVRVASDDDPDAEGW